MKKIPIKIKLIVFLSFFAAFLWIGGQNQDMPVSILTAFFSATLTDSAFSYFKRRNFSASSSSVVSALIVGFVLSGGSSPWIIALASLFSVASKHLICFRGRHIFNPAAFGVFLSAILFGAETGWSGTFLWYVLLPAGLYFAYRVARLEVIAGYALGALGLFGFQALSENIPLMNIFGYLSYFFVFIMLIEPKTTPVRPLAKMIFGFGVACLIFVFIQIGSRFDHELAALLAFNISVPLLNRIPERRNL